MDFAELFSDTQTVEINGPGEYADKVFITIELRSAASDEVKAVDRKQQTRASKVRGGRLSATDQEKFGVERLCAFVASWAWAEGLKFEGKKPDDSDEFKRQVFTSNSPAAITIMNRIQDALADEEGFTKG